ncbi:Ras association domain protein [Necator americanus]|uniref:Ras association domain protein n=1 Tax=Necator americanus TaxID=51031 RepID=W2TMA0_NECAM|nr:Ras association domain protein [Necator americanus]ETN82883.1 Ras association domain protein [Necator americanus]
MLKYQVRTSNRPSAYGSPSSSTHDTTLTSRSNSLASLNSVDSANSDGDWGTLRVYTSNVKACTDYKTIRVSTQCTVRSVIDTVLSKFKISCRDTNLFELWMEVTTKANGKAVRTILRLDHAARPLELQRCHPANMSRFMLHMMSEGTLVRVHDHNISPQSNYKSLLLAEETTCREAIDILLSMNRKEPEGDYALFLTAPEGEAQIPSETQVNDPPEFDLCLTLKRTLVFFVNEYRSPLSSLRSIKEHEVDDVVISPRITNNE